MANKKNLSLIELLVVLTILSVSFFPLTQIINLASRKTRSNNDSFFIATMIAHHVMESIIAKRDANPNWLPSVCDYKSIVLASDTESVNEYFDTFVEYDGAITQAKDSRLFETLKKYKCRIDSYFLEKDLFKIVVYITYLEDKIEKKIYLERILSHNSYNPENETETETIVDKNGRIIIRNAFKSEEEKNRFIQQIQKIYPKRKVIVENDEVIIDVE